MSQLKIMSVRNIIGILSIIHNRLRRLIIGIFHNRTKITKYCFSWLACTLLASMNHNMIHLQILIHWIFIYTRKCWIMRLTCWMLVWASRSIWRGCSIVWWSSTRRMFRRVCSTFLLGKGSTWVIMAGLYLFLLSLLIISLWALLISPAIGRSLPYTFRGISQLWTECMEYRCLGQSAGHRPAR